MVDLLSKALAKENYQHTANLATGRIKLENGFNLRPVCGGITPIDQGGCRTMTNIYFEHPDLAPEPAFEYQHSVGDSAESSIAKGFEQWVQLDLATLSAALEDKLTQFTALEMAFPATETEAALTRRAVLGAVAHLATNPDPNAGQDEHSFCPCCLFTRSMPAFERLVREDRFLGIRFFAMRNAEGLPEADCRVNGEEFEAGKEALRKYIDTWPNRGFEFRKQYVVVHSKRSSATADAPC